MSDRRKFSSWQVVCIVAALCVAIAPAGAVAANSAFTIADPVRPSYKARVDSGGHLLVGTNGNTLNVGGTVRTINPVDTWFASRLTSASMQVDLTPFVATSIALADLTVANADGVDSVAVVYAASQPATASNTSCQAAPYKTEVWQGIVSKGQMFFGAFAVPLRTAPSNNLKVCFFVRNTSGFTVVSANGYYGG